MTNIIGLESYRRRVLRPNHEIWVYRNLMRGDGVWYSLMQRGCVMGHCRGIILRDARFIVRDGGRRRVLETGVKNVHAFVVGTLVMVHCISSADPDDRVTYKPKIFSTFVDVRGAAVRRASLVTIGEAGVFAEDVA